MVAWHGLRFVKCNEKVEFTCLSVCVCVYVCLSPSLSLSLYKIFLLLLLTQLPVASAMRKSRPRLNTDC